MSVVKEVVLILTTLTLITFAIFGLYDAAAACDEDCVAAIVFFFTMGAGALLIITGVIACVFWSLLCPCFIPMNVMLAGALGIILIGR